jgi:hypothetical protein
LRDPAANAAVADDHRAKPRLPSSIYWRRGAVAGAEQLTGRSTDVNRFERPNPGPEWRQQFECVAEFITLVAPERRNIVESDRITIRRTNGSADRIGERNGNADAVRVTKPDSATDGRTERYAARVVRDGNAPERNRGYVVQLHADFGF